LASRDSTSKDYSFKKESVEKDFVEKVATLDEEASPESSDWRSIVSSTSPDYAINALLGINREQDNDEDVDDPPEASNSEETKTDDPSKEEGSVLPEASQEESSVLPEPSKEESSVLLEPSKEESYVPPEEVDCSTSKYFKANYHTLGKPTDKGLSVDQFTIVDDKLPDGWKVKQTTNVTRNGRKDTKRIFLTKDHKVLKTGLAVLEYMRLTGTFSAKEIMDTAKHLAVPVNRLEKYMELYL